MVEYFFGIIVFALLAIVINAIKILREYERGVIFQLGRFWKVKGPGLIIVIPVIQQMERGGSTRHRDGCTHTGRHFAGQRIGTC